MGSVELRSAACGHEFSEILGCEDRGLHFRGDRLILCVFPIKNIGYLCIQTTIICGEVPIR